MPWLQTGSTILASFTGSFVEFVEALTVVLAVGITRGWRNALSGAGVALLILTAAIIIFGRSLALLPLTWIQLVIGALLFLFGLKWLRKAILRYRGVIPLHDEEKAFKKEIDTLTQDKIMKKQAWDNEALMTAFKITMLEGVEAIFIVIAMGSQVGLMKAAILGGLLALVMVILLGFILHKPLTKVPENMLKYIVGLLLTSFGIFWLGEGLHFSWLGNDFALLFLLMICFVVSQMAIRYKR